MLKTTKKGEIPKGSFFLFYRTDKVIDAMNNRDDEVFMYIPIVSQYIILNVN